MQKTGRQKRTSPAKAGGARKRSANQARPGGKCRAEIRAETQTGNNGRKYPAGTTKTKKHFLTNYYESRTEHYKLTVDGQIADQSRPGQPLEFIFGTGMLLPKFEEAILGKEVGEAVSFTLEPKDGYGELIADAVVDLPKNIFMVDGKLAEDILFVGSQVPMSDNQGNRMMGIVKEVGEETVKMDFNHPMAGKTLNFDVEIVSVRDVTPEDLQGGCSCGDCGDDCGGGCDHEKGHCDCH